MIISNLYLLHTVTRKKKSQNNPITQLHNIYLVLTEICFLAPKLSRTETLQLNYCIVEVQSSCV